MNGEANETFKHASPFWSLCLFAGCLAWKCFWYLLRRTATPTPTSERRCARAQKVAVPDQDLNSIQISRRNSDEGDSRRKCEIQSHHEASQPQIDATRAQARKSPRFF